jgi:hypothetical protein
MYKLVLKGCFMKVFKFLISAVLLGGFLLSDADAKSSRNHRDPCDKYSLKGYQGCMNDPKCDWDRDTLFCYTTNNNCGQAESEDECLSTKFASFCDWNKARGDCFKNPCLNKDEQECYQNSNSCEWKERNRVIKVAYCALSR